MPRRDHGEIVVYRTGVRWPRVVGAMVVLALLASAVVHQLSDSSSTSPSSSSTRAHRMQPAKNQPLGEADGATPDGTSVFDDGVPGVANLDPDLLGALREAADDASTYGIQFVVDSGWRSAAYQAQLLRDAIAKYGSVVEASRWVATPRNSAHVSGDAVDIGPNEAAAWVTAHGAAYGLCQIYANEPWHFELRPDATSQGCPGMYADPTQDPRMSQ